MSRPYEARQVAESFGADAEGYDRTRPRYPTALVERIAARGPDVLDVGSGTGIVARQLQAAGCRVLGVEPDERMAAFGGATASRPRWRRSRSGACGRFAWQRIYTATSGSPRYRRSAVTPRSPPISELPWWAGIGAAIDAVGGRFVMGYTTLAVAASAVPT